MTTPTQPTPVTLSVADINFALPIEVIYSKEHNVVLGARLMVTPTQGVDLHSLLEQDDWEHLDALLVNLGYLSPPPDQVRVEEDFDYWPDDLDSNNSL
jgi:hypothetical protein